MHAGLTVYIIMYTCILTIATYASYTVKRHLTMKTRIVTLMALIRDRVVMILSGEKLLPTRMKGSNIKYIITSLATPKMNASEADRITPP